MPLERKVFTILLEKRGLYAKLGDRVKKVRLSLWKKYMIW